MFHARHPACESRSVLTLTFHLGAAPGTDPSESNGTCYIEKVPRECEIRRMRSGEGGEKRDKEKERNVVWPVSSSAFSLNGREFR